MHCTLDLHFEKYSLSLCERTLAIGTLSGAPYALRHYQLSKTSNFSHCLGHRIICALEFIPILGALAALIERIVVWIYNKCFPFAIDSKIQLEPRGVELKKRIEALLATKQFQHSHIDLTIPSHLKPKLNHIDPLVTHEGRKVCLGGRNAVVFIPGIDHLVFKRPVPQYINSKDTNYVYYFVQYKARAQKAAKVCAEHNLYLLQAPQCSFIAVKNVEGKKDYFLIQEKVPLEAGDNSFQQSIWTSLIHSTEPIIQEYTKELLKQIAIFICKMLYSDVKFDNFPITKQGLVALIDLDEDGMPGDALKGITKGIIINRNFGLFKMVPSKLFEEIVDHVKKTLTSSEVATFITMIEDLRKQVSKRESKRQEKMRYLQAKNIKHISEPVFLNNSLKISKLFQKIINRKHIEQANYWDLVVGRKVQIKYNELPHNLTPKDNYTALEALLRQELRLMRENHEIYSFKFHDSKSKELSVTLFC
jgi:hypothetical protein